MTENPDRSMGSLDDLKQVKEAETLWETKVREAAATRKAALDRLGAEADAIIKAERASAEESREIALRDTRAAADREAARIVGEGEKAAAAVRSGSGKRPADQGDAILDAVLGSFRGP